MQFPQAGNTQTVVVMAFPDPGLTHSIACDLCRHQDHHPIHDYQNHHGRHLGCRCQSRHIHLPHKQPIFQRG